MVEVMVAILILAIAIIPMVGMFDAGLRAASTGSKYDKARALANSNLEAAKAMSFSDVKNLSSCVRENSPVFKCTATSKPVRLKDTGDSAVKEFEEYSSSNPDMLKITFTVKWGADSSYSTSGIVAKN